VPILFDSIFTYYPNRPNYKFILFPYTTLFRSRAADDENRRRTTGSPTLRVEIQLLGDRPSGMTPRAHPLVQAAVAANRGLDQRRSEEHTSELQSRGHIVCRFQFKKKYIKNLRT